MNQHITTTGQTILFHGVMISSTFRDLEKHRQALAKALNDNELMHVSMENVPAIFDAGLISSSMAMVRKASAYILIIGMRYGQIPKSTKLNPNQLSITELEFLEAQRLGKPTLLFLMDSKHPITIEDIDFDPEVRAKLDAFRNRAKSWHDASDTDRVYASFDSLEDFAGKATTALAKLRQHLRPLPNSTVTETTGLESYAGGVRAPALYADPRYLGSHPFVGRREQLRALDEWAGASDTHPAFLFEAIGGSGKSILAWHWLTTRSKLARNDWAGRFWYSFYERGAQTKDFLLRALAYMLEMPSEQWMDLPHHKLVTLFLAQLNKRPWLFVLDGVERLLVDYNRHDAEYRNDDQVGTEDIVSNRPPLAMIREEDDQLFRLLAAASSSKILLTSRLLPRCMVNSANQPLPGLLHQRLTGLVAEDAEVLFRACGVAGESTAIRGYLKENCDCHPLVVGILAGIVNKHPPARGNFDQWREDPLGGATLDLARLNLTDRRNHILRFALDSLSEQSRDLLSKLALLLNEFDYKALIAFHRRESGEPASTLMDTIEDLETHGFLLFDRQSQLYDLHPVVRSVVIGSLADSKRIQAGEAVIDHFLSAAARPLSDAKTLEDVLPAMQVVQTYLKLGQYSQAWQVYASSLFNALWLNLELNEKNLALLRAFFVEGWNTIQPDIPQSIKSDVFNCADVALAAAGFRKEAMQCGMRYYLRVVKSGSSRSTAMNNLAHALADLKHGALAHRIWTLCLSLAEVECDDESLFLSHMNLMLAESAVGNSDVADTHWQSLDPLGRDWAVTRYRQGQAEYCRLLHQFEYSEIDAATLSSAEAIANGSRASRGVQRKLLRLRGTWHLKRKELDLAASCLGRATEMARSSGWRDPEAETLHLRARLHRIPVSEAMDEATRLAAEQQRSELELALIWEELGDYDRARVHAIKACEEICADGEAWANRAKLANAQALIGRVGGVAFKCEATDPRMSWPVQIDGFPSSDEFFRDVESAIAKLAEENKERILRHKSAPIADRKIASRGHLIHKLKAKDTTKRWAYYFVLVNPEAEASFLKALEGDGTIDLEHYGQIVASCYGEEPTDEVKGYLYEKYGFRTK